MSNVVEYKDISAFHPGYYIADIIEDMGITQEEFATRMGTTPKTLSNLINGQANLSNDLAKKLSAMMGTSTDVWLNLQNSYDQKLIEIQKARDYDDQEALARLIDYKYFMSVASLPSARTINDKISNLCSYLKVSDLRILLNQDFLVNFRSGISTVNDKNVVNSRAWLQTAINISQSIETSDYDASKLKSYLPELRCMTIQEPEDFIPKIRQLLAECGVAFVLLPALKNSGVNGAVKWITGKRVVLAMNNRRHDADVFWFAFFHEIRHVFQRKIKTTFISYNENEMIEANKKLEEDADKFAADFLISPEELKDFSPTKYTSDEEIVRFAETIGVHPGIVAGRLQHEGIIPQNRCSKLKVKYHFDQIAG